MKKYPYMSEDGKTAYLAKVETEEKWEDREQLPPPPEEIYIPPFTSEEIDFILNNLETL